jgi:hypothetical protein
MEDYPASIMKIEDIREAENGEELTQIEMKTYQKFVGKIAWLASNCRPDLAVTVLIMSKKNSKAEIRDLKKMNKVIYRIREKPNRVTYGKIGKKEDLVVLGLTDASYKPDEKSISGQLIALGNRKNNKVCPLFWKSKQIVIICHSVKEAETRSLLYLTDTATYTTYQIRQLLFGEKGPKLSVKLFMDSKPLLESISSIHQIEEQQLRNTIEDMKEMLKDGRVESFCWLDTKDMIADTLTKEVKPNEDLEAMVLEGTFRNSDKEYNKVFCENEEVKMMNRRNKKEEKSEI